MFLLQHYHSRAVEKQFPSPDEAVVVNDWCIIDLYKEPLPLYYALDLKDHKNSAEVDIAPAFGEITTACNVGQAKKGHS